MHLIIHFLVLSNCEEYCDLCCFVQIIFNENDWSIFHESRRTRWYVYTKYIKCHALPVMNWKPSIHINFVNWTKILKLLTGWRETKVQIRFVVRNLWIESARRLQLVCLRTVAVLEMMSQAQNCYCSCCASVDWAINF